MGSWFSNKAKEAVVKRSRKEPTSQHPTSEPPTRPSVIAGLSSRQATIYGRRFHLNSTQMCWISNYHGPIWWLARYGCQCQHRDYPCHRFLRQPACCSWVEFTVWFSYSCSWRYSRADCTPYRAHPTWYISSKTNCIAIRHKWIIGWWRCAWWRTIPMTHSGICN